MPDTARRQLLVTECLLVLMALIWGVNFAVMKYGTTRLEPLAYNGVRLTVGTLAMLTIVTLRRAPPLAWRDIRTLLALGSLGTGLYQVFFINGLARTRAGTASLVVAASPAVIAIVGRLLGAENVNSRAIVGIAMSIAGVAFVIFTSAASGAGPSSTFGDLLILTSVVCWSFYTHLLKPLTYRIDGLQIAAWTLVGGTIPVLVLAAPSMLAANWHAVSPLTWGCVLYSGIGSMGIAYLFWYRGVRVIGSTRTAMFSNLQPIVALGVSWPLLGERPTLFQGVGVAAVLGGLLLTRQTSAPEPAHGE
ncbi:MAG TPA: DMT family transporter [Gemmatimonadaceae bacterium]|nr:DMT family transporter [Gemmatimonadaceae bacterium]